ncbi:MAG: hypothetical protein R3E58_03010 [Phycisphaerae bacterium]
MMIASNEPVSIAPDLPRRSVTGNESTIRSIVSVRWTCAAYRTQGGPFLPAVVAADVVVTHFTDEDDIRSIRSASNAFVKVGQVDADFALCHAALLVRMDEFDRFFRHDGRLAFD